MRIKNKKTSLGLNVEINLPIKKNINGYDNKQWSYENCTRPIYLNPSEFNSKVTLTIPSNI